MLDRGDGRRQGGQVRSRIPGQQLGQQVQRFRIHQRLIALKVDDHIGLQLLGHFRDAVGAAGMVAPRQHHLAAESLDRRHDADIICGNDHLIDPAPGGRVRTRVG